jgi:hypothetical protein
MSTFVSALIVFGMPCSHGIYYYYYYYYLVCETIGTAATPGPLCQPRVITKMIVEKQMECRLAGETEVLGENLPQRHHMGYTRLSSFLVFNYSLTFALFVFVSLFIDDF